MDGWNTSFLLGWPIFRCYVSLRECTSWFLVLSLLLCHQDIHAVLAYRLYGQGWALVMTDTMLTSSVRGSEKKRGQLPGWKIGVYPAPVEVGSLIIVYTIISRVYTSLVVVSDFFHQQYQERLWKDTVPLLFFGRLKKEFQGPADPAVLSFWWP